MSENTTLFNDELDYLEVSDDMYRQLNPLLPFILLGLSGPRPFYPPFYGPPIPPPFGGFPYPGPAYEYQYFYQY